MWRGDHKDNIVYFEFKTFHSLNKAVIREYGTYKIRALDSHILVDNGLPMTVV